MRTAISPAQLQACLKRAVDVRAGRQASIAASRREPVRGDGKYEWEKVTVQLDDGRDLAFLLKDFARPTRWGTRVKETRLAEREVRVYRDLLATADLGTPRCYGTGLNKQTGEYWMLLEWVHGNPLHQRDLAAIQDVARWLARFQTHFLACPAPVDGCDALIRHETAWFLERVERAGPVLDQQCPELAHRLRQGWDRLRPEVDQVDRPPRTLVHGEFHARHILVDAHPESARICVLDWELAAVGSTLFDVAHLTYNLAPADRDVVVASYRREAARCGVPIGDPATVDRRLNTIDLLATVHRLGKSVRKKYPVEKVNALVQHAGRSADQLGL